jgi:hypothetical protein
LNKGESMRKQRTTRQTLVATLVLTALSATVFFTGCGQKGDDATARQTNRPEFVTEPAIDTAPEATEAKRVAQRLGGGLQKLLAEELAKGGFEGAARVCSQQAQALTDELQGPPGSSVRRVSLRFRNPKDQPDPYEAAILREWEARRADGETLPEESAEVLRVASGPRQLRYLKPIVVQPMCLSCHGKDEQIPAEVREIVQARYPNDLATGYAAGDLRGAISVVMPLRQHDESAN